MTAIPVIINFRLTTNDGYSRHSQRVFDVCDRIPPGVIALQLISGVWLVQRLGYVLTTLDIGPAYGSLITDLLIRKVGDRGDRQ